MTLFTRGYDAKALENLLDRERVVILNGDFKGLKKIQRDKNRMLAGQLNTESVARRKHSLKRKIERNQNLLLATAKGVKSIAQTLNSNNQGGGTLDTYGEDGRLQTHTAQSASFERRA